MKDKSQFKTVDCDFSPFDDLPKGINHFEELAPHRIKSGKTLILSDLQVPFHDEYALKVALEHGIKENCDSLLWNGDIGDFYSLSDFVKNPKLRDLKLEREMTQKIFEITASAFPKSVLKEGNHEERVYRWVKTKAPEIYGMNIFSLEQLWDTERWGIEIIGEKRVIKLGPLNVLHGHEFAGRGGGGVNPARSIFLKAKAEVLIGHHHRSSHHSEVSIEGKSINSYSTGALCDLNPEFARYNNWNHGFAIVEHTESEYECHNLKIINKKKVVHA